MHMSRHLFLLLYEMVICISICISFHGLALGYMHIQFNCVTFTVMLLNVGVILKDNAVV